MSCNSLNWWVSDYDLARLAIAVFPVNRDIAMAVAMAESGSDALAWNCPQGNNFVEDSRGLWQINFFAHTFCRDWDFWGAWGPIYQALAALRVSSGGTYWQPWTQYTNNEYAQYLGRCQTALNQVYNSPPPPIVVPPEPPAPPPHIPPPITPPVGIIIPIYQTNFMQSGLPYAFMFGALALYSIHVMTVTSKKKKLLLLKKTR
jgi:hypothetical protein